MKPNAKFWAYHKGDWVKLTLKPGQEIAVHSFFWTDEGSKEEYSTYCYDPDNDCIWSTYDSSERDCDGRHSYHSDVMCPLSELKASPADEQWGSPATPEWRKVSAHQRDYYAEAMGY